MSGITDIRIPLDATEQRFEALVLRAALLEGWQRHHARPAQTSKGWRTPVAGEPGFPDLVLARAGSIIIAELKTEKTSPSPEQKAWLSALAGGPPHDDPEWSSRETRPSGLFLPPWKAVQLWRPRHWPYIAPLLQHLGRRSL